MTVRDEGALAEACLRGDPDAMAEAATLLGHADAYTRGRASEMLADAPLPALRARLEAGLTATERTLWWRVLALRRELGRSLPNDPAWDQAVSVALSTLPPNDGDAWFQVARWSPAAPPGLRAELERRLILHPDPEVAVVAAMLADRPLQPDEQERLADVGGRLHVDALIARLGGGDARAWKPLVDALPRAGALSFEALGTLQRHAPEGVDVSALRPHWDRRWFTNAIHARTAWAAAALGDAEARARLGDWRGHRKADVRSVATAGWVATAPAGHRAPALGALVNHPELAALVSSLDLSDDEVRGWVATRALEHPEVDVRAAAIDVLGRAGERDTLRRRIETEPDPRLRERLTRSIATP